MFRRSLFRRSLTVVLALVLALGGVATLAATGAREAPETGGRQTDGAEAEASDELTVYTYDVFPQPLSDAVTAHFEEEYGVEVTWERFADTGQLFNQVYLERDNPEADVVIGLDNTYLGRIYDSELFERYEPEDIRLREEFLLVDPEYRAIPFDYGFVTLNYDSRSLSDPPETWEDLTSEAYRDSIVLMNPATASPGRNFLLLTVAEFGADEFTDYWERLEPNILTITSTWSEGYGLYTQGEAPIVLSYSTSPAYHIAYEDVTRYKALYLDGTAYAQIEVAGIAKGARNRINAERFIDFMLGPEFQSEIALNQIMYPVHPDVELPDSFQEIPQPERTVSLDEESVLENIQTWLDEWEQVMR
ncbi:MAG: thiamine ABC transporter substrate binding subunit [Spirochaetaceae bacterium]